MFHPVAKKPADLSFLAKLASKPNSKWQKPYKAKKAGAKLLLKKAFNIGGFIDSYADYSVYEIPFEGKLGPDSMKNLGAFFEAARTTTGVAGEGGSWSIDGVNEANSTVVVTVRYSIAD